MAKNYVQIVIHPNTFELEPPTERVVYPATGQKFVVSADWSDNYIDGTQQRKWKRVVVGNFRVVEPDGVNYQLPAGPYVIDDNSGEIDEIPFGAVPASVDYIAVKYDIDYVPYAGETLTWDPVIVIKPGWGGSGSLQQSG